jgi:hypothetical protein
MRRHADGMTRKGNADMNAIDAICSELAERGWSLGDLAFFDGVASARCASALRFEIRELGSGPDHQGWLSTRNFDPKLSEPLINNPSPFNNPDGFRGAAPTPSTVIALPSSALVLGLNSLAKRCRVAFGI